VDQGSSQVVKFVSHFLIRFDFPITAPATDVRVPLRYLVALWRQVESISNGRKLTGLAKVLSIIEISHGSLRSLPRTQDLGPALEGLKCFNIDRLSGRFQFLSMIQVLPSMKSYEIPNFSMSPVTKSWVPVQTILSSKWSPGGNVKRDVELQPSTGSQPHLSVFKSSQFFAGLGGGVF